MSRTHENPDTEASDSAPRRQPLARGIELLTLMVDSDQRVHGVRELASRIGVSPSTAHRLIVDLEKLGLVSRTPEGSYQLGLEFLRLAWTAAARHPIHELSTDTLRRLNELTDETAFFGVYSEQRAQMMFTSTIESNHPLRYVIPLHQWLPIHAGASGLAILAAIPPATQQAILSGTLEAQTRNTLIDPAKLSERIEQIQAQGYALTHGERIDGAVAIAAPVFGPAGVVGVAGLSMPESRFDEEKTEELTDAVRQAAREVTSLLIGAHE